MASSQGRGDSDNRYQALVERIFFAHYRKGRTEFEFARDELTRAAHDLHIVLPKNLGDVIYSIRFRVPLPPRIAATQPKGMEWVIELAGRSRYRFKLLRGGGRIVPREGLVTIKIPDATPEIISAYAQSDEQALLAKLRYNRLVDTFLGITSYSLQNHLRTTAEGIGQIEIDELYVGLDSCGSHYVVPVQAKGGSDFLSTVQASQDVVWCEQTFPGIRCRPISAQFMAEDVIALFELVRDGGDLSISDEKHYKLVPGDDVPDDQKKAYRRTTARPPLKR